MTETWLITGAGGFIGSHVVEAALAAGLAVRAMVHYSSRGGHGHLDSSAPARQAEEQGQLSVVAGDITDPHQTLRLVEGVDVALHLAALIGIPYSYQSAAAYLAVNAMGTLNLLEAARRHACRRVVITSTSEVYGSAQATPMTEDHPLRAQSPYAASKIAADHLAASYHAAFGLPVVVLRPFNTYGPRQSQRALVPTVLAQARYGCGEVRLGALEPRRDLTYVEDTARAFLCAAHAEGIEGEVIHFGSGQAHSVREIAELCLRVSGSQARLVVESSRLRPPASEVDLLLCDAAKARARLGWSPRIALPEGIERAAEFVAAHPELYRPGAYAV